jgi:hypothetical protein
MESSEQFLVCPCPFVKNGWLALFRNFFYREQLERNKKVSTVSSINAPAFENYSGVQRFFYCKLQR